ncbi:MAG: Cys-tRNA(Pro) deacylase [Nocardioides sp.]
MARRDSATGASTPALRALTEASVEFVTHAYSHDPRAISTGALSYGLEAAAALGVDADRVFKTLITEVDSQLTVAVVPVTTQLDLKALARARDGSRAALAEVATAERVTGYLAGGISPFGQKRPLPTVVDESALMFDTVYVSAGRRGLDVEVTPDTLIELTEATVADIAR